MSSGDRPREEILGEDRSEQESDPEKNGDRTVIMKLCRKKEMIRCGH